jgi:prepilin signal peptidase PulO-like enzyme (type II secretory pathway)
MDWERVSRAADATGLIVTGVLFLGFLVSLGVTFLYGLYLVFLMRPHWVTLGVGALVTIFVLSYIFDWGRQVKNERID